MAISLRSLGVAATTAAATYWLDPASGRRRRARLRDQLGSVAQNLRNGVVVGSRDLVNRIYGAAVRTRSLFDTTAVEDITLVERVRACLGRSVGHPGAVEVSAVSGRVTLRGPILAHEYQRLMLAVASVRGVGEVVDQLEVYTESTGVSALQGGRSLQSPRLALMRNRWSPATRLLAGTAGSALMLWSLRNRGATGILGAAVSGALLVRTGSNVPLTQWLGLSPGNSISVHKILYVNAPVDQVFQLLARYESFPLFMRNVRRVRTHPDGRSHWTVAGPAGVSFEWDAVTTRFEPNLLLAWRTVSNSVVRHSGSIRFEPRNGGTCLEVQLSYSPPGGALGHALARFLRSDPKAEIDEDLLRVKTFLESGKRPRDAVEPRAAQSIPTDSSASLDGGQPLH